MSKIRIAALDGDVHVKYIRRKNTDGFRHKYSLGHQERRQLIAETNINALVLFEYYIRLASIENVEINDEDAAEYFGCWSPATVKRHRLTLIRAGWLAVEKAKLTNGRRIAVYYLGKDEVQAAGLVTKSDAGGNKKNTKEDGPKIGKFILPGESKE